MDPLLDIIARQGLDDDGWRRLLHQRADAETDGLPPEQADLIAYTRLNLHRTLRLERTWLPSPELSAQMKRLDRPQTWLVISEPWCGDSAQCLPCVMVTARLNPLVRLRVLPRDDHPAVMDRFLTDGKRSVPILAAFDEAGGELFRWGPRPAAAQVVVDAARREGVEKIVLLERLHLFYGRDRGRALDAELVAVLRRRRDGTA
jgi:hypothetical protein